MFYETHHSFESHALEAFSGENMRFPAHLHTSFELILVTEGVLRVTVEQRRYDVSAGQAALVFPEQVHAMETVTPNRYAIRIFSPDCIGAYNAADRVPLCAVFTPSDTLRTALLSLHADTRFLQIKSVLYALADAFDAQAAYRARCPEEERLLLRIFEFVGKEYGGDCTLAALCRSTSYHYAYLSRYFSERTGMSFTEYVTAYRIGESCARLTGTKDSITKIALDCGYRSLRTFNRNFRQLTGCTPGAYRRARQEPQT